MPQQNTRRTFVKAVGGASFTGIPSTLLQRDNFETDTELRAAELVIPETELPAGFDRHPLSEENTVPIVETLQSLDSRFESSDIAVEGYWKGGNQENPQWVISSLAIVTGKPISQSLVETAAAQAWNQYIAEYEAETPRFVEFEPSRSRGEQASECCLNIFRTDVWGDTESERKPIYTDRLRLQFFENVLLGTIVFGPTDSSPTVESLHEQYTNLQHSRYHS